MNIFVLDENPVIAAKLHADIHVNKMILESTQMLCTVAHSRGIITPNIYKPTHAKHPCTIWLSQSSHNISWLACLVYGLESLRSGTETHKSLDVFCEVYFALNCFGNWKLHTPFAQAMPVELKNTDPVKAYRDYYNYKKLQGMSLKYESKSIIKRIKPEWL